MVRVLKARRIARFALFACLAATAATAAAEVLVLRSVGPSARRYAAGQRLPDNTSFVLRPGDSIAILAAGGTRTFRGPGTFSATGPVRIGGLGGGTTRRTTGAARGDDFVPVPHPASPWQIDISQGGRACVAAGATPMLWRPNAQRAVDLVITPQVGAPRTVRWPAGQATLAWPAGIGVVDGASYQLGWTGAASPSRITLRTLPVPATANVAAAATALLDRQCRSQLDVLIAVNDAAPR